MPEWEIHGSLTGLVKADASGPADERTLSQVVAEIRGAQLARREHDSCEIRFQLEAVDAAEAVRVGFDVLRSAALRHLALSTLTSATAVLVSGSVDAKLATAAHLRSAFMNLTRVVGLFEEIRSDLAAAGVHLDATGLHKQNHEIITAEISDLEMWSAEKMQQLLQRMAELEVGSRG